MTTALSPIGRAALAYAQELGWPVVPLHTSTGAGCSCRNAACSSVAKHPRTMNGLKDATIDVAKITQWWTNWPDANIGIPTGAVSGLMVVDIDGPAGEEAMRVLNANRATPQVLTGKGRHVYFAHPGFDVRNTAKRLGPELDTRGDGGYVVAPPSVHASGRVYAWDREGGFSPREIAPAPIPDTILAELTRMSAPDGNGASALDVAESELIPSGARNETLTRLAGRLARDRFMTEKELYLYVRDANVGRCQPPLDDDAVRTIARNISTREARKPREEIPAADPPTPPPTAPVVWFTPDLIAGEIARNARPIDATPTGFALWNRACRDDGGGVGIARGWHVTIGGASGNGKSLSALNLTGTALKHGTSVSYISLEMSQSQLITRLLAMATDTLIRCIERGGEYDPADYRFAAEQFQAALDAAGSRFAVIQRPDPTWPVLDRAMNEAVDGGATMLVIDYLQCIDMPSTRDLHERTMAASKAIVRFAQRHNVTTVALSQFNRATTFNGKEPPSIHGLMGGSQIENDSDQVILLDHSSNRITPRGRETKLLLAKNRHGPQAEVPVYWDRSTLALRELPSAADAVPGDVSASPARDDRIRLAI